MQRWDHRPGLRWCKNDDVGEIKTGIEDLTHVLKFYKTVIKKKILTPFPYFGWFLKPLLKHRKLYIIKIDLKLAEGFYTVKKLE